MRSFVVRLEPAACPRLAGAAVLLHAFSALMPWLARVPPVPAALLSVLALAGIVPTLSRLPGRHCRLAAARHDGSGWFVRLAGTRNWQPAELAGASRAYPALVVVAFRAGRRRFGWLLAPGSVPAPDMRRLKARIRLA
jgi:hypothetical protein